MSYGEMLRADGANAKDRLPFQFPIQSLLEQKAPDFCLIEGNRKGTEPIARAGP